jgi:hypothetical protein
MNPTDKSNGDPPLTPEDLLLLGLVARGSDWLRAVLCTLARRGIAFRSQHPQRARNLLDMFAPLPAYKGGQFLFDLLEWEDFMLNGSPPPIVSTTLDARALRRAAAALTNIQSYLDGAVQAIPVAEVIASVVVIDDQNLPPIEPGFYLYQDVVLGIVSSTLPLIGMSDVGGERNIEGSDP